MEQKFLSEMGGAVLDVPSMTTHIDQQQSTLEKMYFVVSPVKLRAILIELLWTKRG